MELLLTCCKALEQDETCRMATLGHLLCTWWKLSAAELMGTLSGATSRQKRALTDDTADLLAAPDDLKFAHDCLPVTDTFSAGSREQVQGFYSSSLAFFNKAESLLCEAGPARKQRCVGANSRRCSGADNEESCFANRTRGRDATTRDEPGHKQRKREEDARRRPNETEGSEQTHDKNEIRAKSSNSQSVRSCRFILGTTFINSRN
ncbi:MAG: hypothetical protein MHM6MM_009536 [Cercozoa sp. M6MM]